MSGLASLVQGMQQGYTFMDDMKRRKTDDARQKADDDFKATTRTRQTRQWDKADAYEGEVAALTESYFPQQKAQAAAPNAPATAGTAMPQAPMGQPDAAGEPAAQLQAATAQPPAAAMGTGAKPAAAPDPLANTNNTFDFTMKRALLDVKHGKLDGAGLLSLQKTMDAMRSEKMDLSIDLLNQGRYDEGINTFNSTGEHKAKLINVTDAVFDAGGVKVPTKIVTLQDGNGAPRTINTAQAMYQQQKMGDIIRQAQTGQQINETGRHNKASEAQAAARDRQSAAQSAASNGIQLQRLAMEKQSFKRQTLSGQIEQIEEATGVKLTADEKKKMAGLSTGKLAPKDKEALIDKMTEEFGKMNSDPKAAALYADGLRRSFKAIETNGQIEQALREDFGSNPPGTPGYAATYNEAKSRLGMTDAALGALGYKPPAAPKAAAQRAAAGGTAMPAPAAPPRQLLPSEMATAGFDAALAQTARQLAAANNAGDKAEVLRLNALFAEQSAAKNAALGVQ